MAINYWGKRIQQAQDKLYNAGLSAAQKQLKEYYKTAAQQTITDISLLYDKLQQEAIDGKIKPNDLYRYNRYFKMVNNLSQQLKQLGGMEIKIDNQAFLSVYNTTQKYINQSITPVMGSFAIDNQRAQQVVERVWLADGKSWSQRIWGNKEVLQKSIEKGMVDCVSRGVSKDEMVKEMQYRFAVDFNKADRIVRTELTHVQNEAAADSYKTAGIEYYQYLATDDDRTSEECLALDGQIFRMDEAITGVNFPPMHANCRCTIIPFFNDNKGE